jgi:hypothetical protein
VIESSLFDLPLNSAAKTGDSTEFALEENRNRPGMRPSSASRHTPGSIHRPFDPTLSSTHRQQVTG